MDSSGTLGLPQAGSTIAADVDPLWGFILWASVVMFALVGGVIIWFLIRYRRRREGELTSGRAHNLPLEIAWTAIPTVLILIIFVWGFKGFLKMQVPPGDALEVQVTGQRWFWTFDYADGVNSVNELVVPVDKPVKLLMSSSDVIHSFYIPNFRIKMDVIPNRYTITWFEATREGVYNLFCTEYCGRGHSSMLGTVRVVGEREYNEWLEKSSSGEGMSLEEFGAELYKRKACVTCHSIDGSKNTGPSFLNTYNRTVVLTTGGSVTADENYIRESILNPQAKVAAGFQPVMPSYQGLLKPRQVDALIAYIKSLQQ